MHFREAIRHWHPVTCNFSPPSCVCQYEWVALRVSLDRKVISMCFWPCSWRVHIKLERGLQLAIKKNVRYSGGFQRAVEFIQPPKWYRFTEIHRRELTETVRNSNITGDKNIVSVHNQRYLYERCVLWPASRNNFGGTAMIHAHRARPLGIIPRIGWSSRKSTKAFAYSWIEFKSSNVASRRNLFDGICAVTPRSPWAVTLSVR